MKEPAPLDPAPLRKFTAQSQTHVELLTLSLNDIIIMKNEFPSAFQQLFNNARDELRKDLNQKFTLIRIHELENAKHGNNVNPL